MALEDTTGQDWFDMIIAQLGNFSLKGEGGGKPDWKSIERLMAMDAENNRTDRHGMFSNWDWDQGEDGRWTQSNTPAAGFGGGMEYLKDRMNGEGFGYFDSPEQFNSMLDGKMANQMDRQGLLTEMPDLRREFGEGSAEQYGNQRSFMDGKDYSQYENVGTTGGGGGGGIEEQDEFGDSISPLAEQGNTYQDEIQSAFQSGEQTGQHMDNVNRDVINRWNMENPNNQYNGPSNGPGALQKMKDWFTGGSGTSWGEKGLKYLAKAAGFLFAGTAGSAGAGLAYGDPNKFGKDASWNDPNSKYFVGPPDPGYNPDVMPGNSGFGDNALTGTGDMGLGDAGGMPGSLGPRNQYGNGRMAQGGNNSIGRGNIASRIRPRGNPFFDDPRLTRPLDDKIGG